MRSPVLASVALALLVVPLAGCLGDASDTTPSNLPDPGDNLNNSSPSGLELLNATRLTETGTAFEPSVVADRQGNVYVTAAQGIRIFPTQPDRTVDASRLWVSNDRGSSWREIEAVDPSTGVSNLPLGAEGDLALAQDGTVYFVDLAHVAGVPVARSTDAGETWELRSPNAFAVPVGDREWVATGPGETVVVGWNQVPSGQWVAVSTDGGRTFPIQTRIPGTELVQPGAGGIGEDGASAGVPAVDSDGNIYLARAPSQGPTVYRSTDGGLTFEETVVHETSDPTDFIFAVADVDDADNVYVLWAEPVDGNVEAFYAYSSDQGETWSDPIQVTAHNGSTVLPWLDATDDGRLAVAYYGAPDARGRPGEVDDAAWYPMLTVVDNATGPNRTLRHTTLADEPVKEGPVCVSGLACNGNRELADYLQVAFGATDDVHVAWGDVDQNVYWGLVSDAKRS